LTPIGLDLVDIATTLFIHLGLVYSLLFNYAGLLLGAANARLPVLPLPPKQMAEEGKDESKKIVSFI
jgi:hypothetical protein